MFVTGNMGIGTINPYANVDIETLQEGGQSFFVNGSNSVNPVASIQNNYYSGAKASQPALVVMAKGPTDFGVLRVIRNGGPAGGIMSNWVGDNSSDVVVFYSNGAGRFAGNLTATAFNTLSDRESKEHFESIRPRDVLDKVAALPLSQWNFKTETASRHVGPMAQDFYAAFGLGQDEKHIATVDAEGVALAAIQGLNQKVDEQAAELKAKEAELQALKQSLAELKEAVARLPQAPR